MNKKEKNQTATHKDKSVKNRNFWSVLAFPLLVATGFYLYFVVWPSFYPPPPSTTTIVAGIGLFIFIITAVISIRGLNKKFTSMK